MNATTLQKLIEDESIRQCGHEERKGKLSMSWLHLPEGEILQRVRTGCQMDDQTKLKLFQGTWAEEGMINRLMPAIYGETFKKVFNVEISAFDSRLTGHIDFILDAETIVEYKCIGTREKFDKQKAQGKVPFKVFSQVQSYLLWGKYKKAFVVYECRDDGTIWVTEMPPHLNRQHELMEIAMRILSKI
jgi:hypothetical protein